MKYLIPTVFVYLWGVAYLWHLFLPLDWIIQWYAFPLMVTMLAVGFAALMVTIGSILLYCKEI